MPAEQLRHAVAPLAIENAPVGQATQMPLGMPYVPTGHRLHTVAPGLEVYLPARQVAQTDAVALQIPYWPAGQTVQAAHVLPLSVSLRMNIRYGFTKPAAEPLPSINKATLLPAIRVLWPDERIRVLTVYAAA